MNAKNLSVPRAGLVVCSVLAVALTGCRTQVVHSHTRTVYVPAPQPQVVNLPAPQLPPPVVVVPPPEQPPVVVIQSENDFYEPLGAYGRWVVVSGYGRCWIPARVEAGWRPYSNGYWQRTDAGWYWASEEPWGWATYHYGRWDFHTEFGWLWVPHTQWAPAWVCWREGGGYVGWAPLRPSVTIGVNIRVADYEPVFASRAFVFVEHRRMLEPVRPKTVIVNNTTIINKTVNITRVTVVNKTVINEGPRPEVIERASGRKVQAVPAHEFRRKEEATVAARQRHIPTAPGRTEIGRKVATTPVTVKPETKPEVKAEQAVEPRREVRPAEKPALAAKPTLQPVRTNPIPGEKKREPAIEKKNTAKPPAIKPKPSYEVRPESRRETNPPVNVGTMPPSAVKKQTAPPSEKPAGKRLISPKEKARAAEQAEANKKKKEDKGPKKKGEAQETQPPAVPTRPPQ